MRSKFRASKREKSMKLEIMVDHLPKGISWNGLKKKSTSEVKIKILGFK